MGIFLTNYSIEGSRNDIVEKHGSHDQSTHNPHKGGRVGGGGAATQTTGAPELDSSHVNALAGQERALRGIASGSKVGPRGQVASASRDEYVKAPIEATVRAANHVERGRKSKDASELKTHISNAQRELQIAKDGFENENYHDIVGVLHRTSVNLNTIATAAGNGTKMPYELPTGLSDS